MMMKSKGKKRKKEKKKRNITTRQKRINSLQLKSDSLFCLLSFFYFFDLGWKGEIVIFLAV